MGLIQKLVGEHDRIPYLRMSWLSTNVRTAQRLDRQPGPAQDTKLHLLPPKAAVANLKRFVRRHRKSEVSWGRTQQLSSCRTRFENTLPPFPSQCQEYTRHLFWVLWAAWSAGERSPITYFCSEVKKWGCSLPNQKEVWKCGTGSKMKQMVKYRPNGFTRLIDETEFSLRPNLSTKVRAWWRMSRARTPVPPYGLWQTCMNCNITCMSFIQNFQDTSKLNDKEWLWLAHGVPHAHNAIAYQLPKERAQRPHDALKQRCTVSIWYHSCTAP